MSTIPSQFSPAGVSSRQNALSDAQFSSYVRQQAVTTKESLSAGLTIKTREGDLVTLTSDSYSQLDAYSYNSKGIVQTEDGTAVMKQNYREVTLSSGDNFSFSVVGDLSEAELEDIESIINGIDEIIGEMTEGDMDEAVATAMSMGGYDTVSEYSADITYERSFAAATRTQTQSQNQEQVAPPEDASIAEPAVDAISENNVLPKPEQPIPAMEPFPENTRPWRKNGRSVQNFDKFIEKMADQIEKYEEKLVEKAQKPIDKLLGHHLEKARDNDAVGQSVTDALADARKQVQSLIEQFTSGMFSKEFSAFLGE